MRKKYDDIQACNLPAIYSCSKQVMLNYLYSKHHLHISTVHSTDACAAFGQVYCTHRLHNLERNINLSMLGVKFANLQDKN
jgi:hypothetical protein